MTGCRRRWCKPELTHGDCKIMMIYAEPKKRRRLCRSARLGNSGGSTSPRQGASRCSHSVDTTPSRPASRWCHQAFYTVAVLRPAQARDIPALSCLPIHPPAAPIALPRKHSPPQRFVSFLLFQQVQSPSLPSCRLPAVPHVLSLPVTFIHCSPWFPCHLPLPSLQATSNDC